MKHDLFSRHAPDYAQFRPHYPDDLFAYLRSVTADRVVVWDCATGNGQAAVGLAAHFDHVIATDASPRQLRHATPHARVRYLASSAEASPLRNQSADLVTVAQALHWLDREAFFREATRVLRPGGVAAVWCYTGYQSPADLKDVLELFYRDRVGRYWLPPRRLVEEGYRSVAFPFQEMTAPAFRIRVRWSLTQLLGYVETWSAVQRAREAGEDPLPEVRDALGARWGAAERKRDFTFPLALRVGRNT